MGRTTSHSGYLARNSNIIAPTADSIRLSKFAPFLPLTAYLLVAQFTADSIRYDHKTRFTAHSISKHHLIPLAAYRRFSPLWALYQDEKNNQVSECKPLFHAACGVSDHWGSCRGKWDRRGAQTR